MNSLFGLSLDKIAALIQSAVAKNDVSLVFNQCDPGM